MGLMIFGVAILLIYFLVARNFVKETVRGGVTTLCSIVAAAFIGWGGWSGAMFYAQPEFNYQVKTFTGDVIGYSGSTQFGWQYKGFGDVNAWKRNLSISHTDDVANEEEMTTAQLTPHTIRMLDRVDGTVEQTTRFKLPDDVETFLKLAAEYRTPDNLIRTELIPTVQQVITASSSLMSAEDYFNGKRNEFQLDFEYQMRNGIFMVDRKEVTTTSAARQTASADASKGANQEEFGTQTQTRFVVTKLTNQDGTYKVNKHNFTNFGIMVVDAKITDFDPNDQFKRRMEQQQQASADRSIAREQRIQEEEQKQLAVVRGDREIAEEQARVKKAQIKRTTEAETEKALALITATRMKEEAAIQKETAQLQLDRDKIAAQSRKVLADAEAYAKEAVIKADNALAQKLEAEIKIQEVWAEAFASRAVPNNVFSSGASAGDTPTGSNSELQMMMQMMTMDMAKKLDYDRSTKSN